MILISETYLELFEAFFGRAGEPCNCILAVSCVSARACAVPGVVFVHGSGLGAGQSFSESKPLRNISRTLLD